MFSDGKSADKSLIASKREKLLKLLKRNLNDFYLDKILWSTFLLCFCKWFIIEI